MIGLQLNCNSINTKLVDIKLLVYNNKPDFVAFSETWLKKDKIPTFVNYTSEWKNRPSQTGGGLGFLIKRGIQYSTLVLTPYPNGVLEFQAIKIYNNQQFITILSIYNPI